MIDNNLANNIFQSSPIASVVLLPNDPIYTVVEANKAFFTTTGIKELDVLGQGFFETFPLNPKGNNPGSVARLQESLKIVKDTGVPHKMAVMKYDVPIPDTNKFEERYWESLNSPVFNERQEVSHILLSIEDFTNNQGNFQQHNNNKISLENSQQRYRSLFFNNPDAVYSFDLDGNFIEANAVTAELCETTIKHLLQISFLPLIAEKDKDRVYRNFLKSTKGEVVNYNTSLVTVKGNHKVINITNMPIIVDNNIIGVYGVGKDITEKLAFENELEMNRLKTQRILDQSLDVICTIDEMGCFIEVSRASYQLWGYHPDELIGTPYRDLIYEDDLEITSVVSKKIISGQDTRDFQNRYKHKNGHLVPVIWSAKWDAESKVMYCVARDGTESLRNKKYLMDSQRKYKFLFKKNPAAMFIWDLESHKILDANKKALSIYGYKREKFLTLSIEDIRPSYQDNLQDIIEKLRTTKKIRNICCYHQKQSGDIFHAEVNGQLLNLDEHRVVIVQINDVTERNLIKEKLKSERNLLRSLIDNLPDTIYFKDVNARKLISNKMDYNFAGASKEEEVIGKTDLEIYGDSMAKTWYDHDLEILDTGKSIYDFEECFKNKSKTETWISTTKLPLKDEKGKIIGLLGIGRNITLQKMAQKKLKEVNLQLEKHIEKLIKSNNELEQYAYVASHDLQEPLRAISTFLSILESKYKNAFDDKGLAYLNFAIEGSLHMRQLILDLLDLSKIGKSEDVYEDVDLNKIISRVKTNKSIDFKGKNISLIVDTLPIINGPKSSIYQLFSNLVSNSIKYRQEGIPLEIKISVESLEHYWQFSVSDNGIGIEPEYFEKIFVVFQRLHGKGKYSGTGVGLAIVKKIVENFGGRIWVESIPGEGSTFYFTISKQNQLLK